VPHATLLPPTGGEGRSRSWPAFLRGSPMFSGRFARCTKTCAATSARGDRTITRRQRTVTVRAHQSA
jgi:hypothetical protein